jgi:hypothetical protein
MRPCEGHSYRLEGRIDDLVSEWHPNFVNTCGRLLASGDFDACGLFLTSFPMELVRPRRVGVSMPKKQTEKG